MARRAARIDRNQPAIVAALRAAGCTVAITSMVGQGFPDLVVATPAGVLLLVEIKDGSLPPSARELTPAQRQFHTTWGSRVDVVHSVQEALALLETIAEAA